MQRTTRTRSSLLHLTQVALIGGVYVALTLLLAPISYGVVQVRLAEMLNYTALFQRRFVWAVTLGVLLANCASATWLIDVPVGALGTLLCLLISRWLACKTQRRWLKFTIMGTLFTLSMCTVAAQLTFVNGLPFWPTYATVALGETLSMTLGGVVMCSVAKVVPFD